MGSETPSRKKLVGAPIEMDQLERYVVCFFYTLKHANRLSNDFRTYPVSWNHGDAFVFNGHFVGCQVSGVRCRV